MKRQKAEKAVNVLYLHNMVNISGGERSLLNLWKHMDKNKYSIHLMIPRNGLLSEEANKFDVRIAHCKVPKMRPRNILDIGKTLSEIVGYCKKEDIKIIHSYTPRNNIISAIAAKLLNIPVIWHERNLPFGDEKDRTRQFLFMPDRVICNSRAIAERFRTRNGIPSKVRVVLNGVDVHRFMPQNVRSDILKLYGIGDRKIVGMVSNLSKRKMPEHLLEACPRVLNRCPHTLFMVVGGEFGDEDKGRKSYLENMAKQLNIEDHVVFTGFMENVSEIIRAFKIGVSVTEKEACSRAVLETMACGKPVVAFNTGGNPELIEHGVTGLLVDSGDIEALTNAITGLLENDSKTRTMGIHARERIETYFDVRINAKKTQEIYSELIG